jgi:EAL domain-containing protein (putative c-di-GMP-specific phosphodiesterase class I)
LAYLADLPVDIVKIDRKFVQQLGTTARADGVFAGIVSLAHTLGFTVIAEGCETEEQLRVIRESGCDGVQGWLLGKAAPPEEITLRLLQRSLGAPGADPVSIPEPLAGTGSR